MQRAPLCCAPPADVYTRRQDDNVEQGKIPWPRCATSPSSFPTRKRPRSSSRAAFDLKRAGNARRGIYLSDGTINVALLKQEGNEKVGLYHFGMWVDDLDESEKKVLDAGGTYLEGRPTSPNSYYEAKYRDPLGIVFDLTHNGWVGATKDVVAKS